MSAVEALKAARAAGLELTLDGDDLVLNAASAPPDAVLNALSRHKAEVVVLLRPGRDGWCAEDWLAFDQSTRRGGSAASHLPRANRPHRVPIRRGAAVFRLSGRRERRRLRPSRREAPRAGRYFLCRHCYRLSYASQSEHFGDCAQRRADKIRQRLGGESGMASYFPPRPKGMWRRTYERLQERAFDAEMIADHAFALRAERLVARIDNRKRKRSFWR